MGSSDSCLLVYFSLIKQVQRFMMENQDAEESRNVRPIRMVSASLSFFSLFMQCVCITSGHRQYPPLFSNS